MRVTPPDGPFCSCMRTRAMKVPYEMAQEASRVTRPPAQVRLPMALGVDERERGREESGSARLRGKKGGRPLSPHLSQCKTHWLRPSTPAPTILVKLCQKTPVKLELRVAVTDRCVLASSLVCVERGGGGG